MKIKKKRTLPKEAEPYRFKKGQSGNPLGGKIHDPEIRAMKKLTKEELKEVGALILKSNVDALQAFSRNKKASVLQTMVAAIAVRIISKGDMQALDVLLNRLIGKVKEEVEHSGGAFSPQVIVRLPANGSEKKD